jgi:hypothetical protein
MVNSKELIVSFFNNKYDGTPPPEINKAIAITFVGQRYFDFIPVVITEIIYNDNGTDPKITNYKRKDIYKKNLMFINY